MNDNNIGGNIANINGAHSQTGMSWQQSSSLIFQLPCSSVFIRPSSSSASETPVAPPPTLPGSVTLGPLTLMVGGGLPTTVLFAWRGGGGLAAAAPPARALLGGTVATRGA